MVYAAQQPRWSGQLRVFLSSVKVDLLPLHFVVTNFSFERSPYPNSSDYPQTPSNKLRQKYLTYFVVSVALMPLTIRSITPPIWSLYSSGAAT